jgi:hypothetical protein
VGEELSDKVVDGLAGLDKEDDTAGRLELGAEVLDRLGTDNVGALGLVGEEVVNLRDGTEYVLAVVFMRPSRNCGHRRN